MARNLPNHANLIFLCQVLTKVEDIERGGTKKVTRFSAVGYSLGGLLARYVLGCAMRPYMLPSFQHLF